MVRGVRKKLVDLVKHQAVSLHLDNLLLMESFALKASHHMRSQWKL